MTRGLFRAALLCAALLAAGPARGGEKEFKRVVARLADHYQTRPMGTGFLGFLMRCFSPSGISGLRMAVFERADHVARPLEGDFDAFLKDTLGPDYALVVQVRSNRHAERTSIFAREIKGGTEMVIVTAEAREAVVMTMKLDAAAMVRWMEEPGRVPLSR